MSLRALLEREYRIASVPSGEAAVEELPRFRPDVVLLDVRLLPSMSGLDALERIKAFDERIEVVMITAFASLATLNEALRRGACGYLIKPFPRRDLELMVRDALARRGPRLELSGSNAPLTGLAPPVRICSHAPSQATGGYRP